MKKLAVFLILLFLFSITGIAQTTLSGQVTESDTGEPVLFGTLALYQDGKAIIGVETDFDGNYIFADLQPGVYDLKASYVGFQAKKITGIKILANEKNIQNISLDSGEIIYCWYPYTPPPKPRFEIDGFSSGQVFKSDDIRRSTKN